jgi:hypothetical protein
MRKRAKNFVPDPVQMLSVYVPGAGGHSTVCCGFIMLRGKAGFEAFDADKSIGVYRTMKDAADALSKAAAALSEAAAS